MISFDSIKKVFYLNTDNTTYIFSVNEKGLLLHLYWGKRLKNDISETYIADVNSDSFGEMSIPLEYSTYGAPDMRMPTFDAVYSDGSLISKFVFAGYEILEGKPCLSGLPATYCENEDKVQTLIVRLSDELKNVDVYLSYSVFEEFDAITRSVKIVNNGDKMQLSTALSASVDLYGMPESDIIHLDGAWGRERGITRTAIVSGNQNVESRYGASSAMHNPFIAVCDRTATENSGNVYGFSLVYSGNFTAGVELDTYGTGRAYIGINPIHFNFILENGDSFQTPEAVLVYSNEGIGGMSRIYHKLYRTRLCRGKYRDTERFVLVNNWEATYFNFTPEKIMEIAANAQKIGVDTVVLDDGWFGVRNDAKSGLGDWFVNKEKLPEGLCGLAEKINAMGMRFGLWFEPEMISPDSDLYRKHPDWALQIMGREATLRRHQLTLDLSRKDVCDYIIDAVCKILESANIEYVKWDMNRYMTEAGSLALSGERQGEVMHRYILGVYYMMETITQRFPNILFESCASGGGRFDPGMLYYMPQTWTSDDTDAVERLYIQYGTSIVYPYSAMGAHVTASPNHQVGRITPFEMRCNVAMPGQFGFELDLSRCTDDELLIAKEAVLEHRRLWEVFHKGNCYRLVSPFENDFSAVEFVSEDKNRAILCIESKKATPNNTYQFIKLDGLEKESLYKLEATDELYYGDFLMNVGIRFDNTKEYTSKRYVFNKV